MKKYTIVFIILIIVVLSIIVAVYINKEKPITDKPITQIPTFSLISAIPFDLKPNNALLAENKLIIFGRNGAYIISPEKPVIDEDTKFSSEEYETALYHRESKLLFLRSKTKTDIYRLMDDLNLIDTISTRPTKFGGFPINSGYSTFVYLVDSNSIITYNTKTKKKTISEYETDASLEGVIELDGKIIGNIVDEESGGIYMSFLDQDSSFSNVTLNGRESVIGKITYVDGNYFLLGVPCYCEIRLLANNIEIIKNFSNSKPGSLNSLVINNDILIGFYEDNSYELFDINSPIKEILPFATGTLPFITSKYESIMHVFNTDNQNELIIITIDNTSIGNIYKVKFQP